MSFGWWWVERRDHIVQVRASVKVLMEGNLKPSAEIWLNWIKKRSRSTRMILLSVSYCSFQFLQWLTSEWYMLACQCSRALLNPQFFSCFFFFSNRFNSVSWWINLHYDLNSLKPWWVRGGRMLVQEYEVSEVNPAGWKWTEIEALWFISVIA